MSQLSKSKKYIPKAAFPVEPYFTRLGKAVYGSIGGNVTKGEKK